MYIYAYRDILYTYIDIHMSVSSGSEHRSIIPMLNKIFSKYFIVFGVFPHTTANFIKLFSSR